MVEDRITELEDKFEKLLSWTKNEFDKMEAYVDELDTAVQTDLRTIAEAFEELEKPKKNTNNKPSNLWSDEETDYLIQRLTGCKTPRPVLISLAEKWEEKFSKARSYDSLRKKWARLK